MDNSVGYLFAVPNILCNTANMSIRYNTGWFTETADTVAKTFCSSTTESFRIYVL